MALVAQDLLERWVLVVTRCICTDLFDQTFRMQQTDPSGFNQDAAAFFNANSTPAPQLAPPNAFDLSAFHASLPSSHLQSPAQAHQQNAVAAWAADFMQRQVPEMNLKAVMQPRQEAEMKAHQPTGGLSSGTPVVSFSAVPFVAG